ncbi:MAG: hypothetical protein LVQ96_04010 [Thermoplasmatales archaeon]|nr:hypothetical protein [Thermoplasmatales archaeon]MCW6170318.1 hypothetical protein [Thermoplasmatales archaeon]
MDSKLSISVVVAVVLTLFTALLFYYILTSITDRFIAGIYVGIISVVFSLVGYFLYAFIGNTLILRVFMWLYYLFGFGMMFYSATVTIFNIPYLLILFIILALSLVFIRWRIVSTSKSQKA